LCKQNEFGAHFQMGSKPFAAWTLRLGVQFCMGFEKSERSKALSHHSGFHQKCTCFRRFVDKNRSEKGVPPCKNTDWLRWRKFCVPFTHCVRLQKEMCEKHLRVRNRLVE
jgi:hypothetical protein